MQKDKKNSGTLYVVATPIGNLDDMTSRAVETLKAVDRIAAEDTRHAGPLLKHFSISKPSISLHDFNERERIQKVLSLLSEGESIALISDAGTPLISDPGYLLVKEAKAAGYRVVPIPGSCALIAALSVSGLPTDKFMFEGFLPHKKEASRQQLLLLQRETRTMIFYEAPHRLLGTLELMVEVFGGERKAVVARELTKIYESVLLLPLQELRDYYATHADELRGEVVILVAGNDTDESLSMKEVDPFTVLKILLAELPLKQAVALASDITGGRKNDLYEIALSLKAR